MAAKKEIIARYFLIVIVMGVLGVFIVIKASIIMFGERDYWQSVADRLVKENVVIKPNRGNILSADGKLMASSLPQYKIIMDFVAGGEHKDSLLRDSIDVIAKGLHKIFPEKSTAHFKKHLEEGRKQKKRFYLIYPHQISYTQYKEVKKLPVFNLNKNSGGFYEQIFNNRKKPFGSLANRTLGDVYGDTAQGAKNGIELAFDTLLKGKDGIMHRQKVKNKFLSIVDKQPVDGYDIISTIDVGMQDICEKALIDMLKTYSAREGVVILMEVATGDVKAIVNMTRGANGYYSETRNGAISNMMEPGSVFKTASIMVALEDGVITPRDGVDTGNGKKQMYDRVMRDHNWMAGGYHYLTLSEIMMKSSNIGVSTLIDNHYAKNPGKFVDGLYRIGLNKPLHLQIPGEGVPRIPHPKDGNWYKTALPWMSIGYGTQIPPMNLLTFYNAIANDGKMVKPRFVKAIAREGEIVKTYPVEVINPAICSAKTLKEVQNILELVVSQGLGKPAGTKQFAVAGKTGTAQISKGAAGYKSGTTDYLVSFAGYFPADKPQYSCIVAIQKSGGPASGGVMGGGVFSKIAERVFAKNLMVDIHNAVDTLHPLVPELKTGDVAQTKLVLKDLGIKDVEVPDKHELSAQVMPSVIGMGAKDALYVLESRGLKVNLSGVGKVRTQSITHGTKIIKGQTVGLQLN